jgi:hypothetical protein
VPRRAWSVKCQFFRLVSLLDVEREHEGQRVIDRGHLSSRKVPCRAPEALKINDRRLLDQHARERSVEIHLGTEGRGSGTCRGRCDEDGTQAEELVSLDDDGKSCAALFMTAHGARRRQPEHIPADH